MKKLLAALLALSFISSTAMALDMGLNAAGPNAGVIHTMGLKIVGRSATQVQFSRVCGESNSYAKAFKDLGNKLSYPFIALDVQPDYETRKGTYLTYLKRPYKIHEKVLFTKEGWGDYNELACVLIEGAAQVH